jgi:hypothetical protein
MNYSQLIQLGFKRIDQSKDNVFFNRYGYKAFLLSKNLSKNFQLQWLPNNPNEVTLFKIKYNFFIDKSWSIKDLDTVAMLCNMF